MAAGDGGAGRKRAARKSRRFGLCPGRGGRRDGDSPRGPVASSPRGGWPTATSRSRPRVAAGHDPGAASPHPTQVWRWSGMARSSLMAQNCPHASTAPG